MVARRGSERGWREAEKTSHQENCERLGVHCRADGPDRIKEGGAAGFLFADIGHEILNIRRQHEVGKGFRSGMVDLWMAGRAVGFRRDLQAWDEARTGNLAKTMAFGQPGAS